MLPKRCSQAQAYCLLTEAALSAKALASEHKAKEKAQEEVPELCKLLINVISCIPRQGQAFGESHEWKPWCRLVCELDTLGSDGQMARILSVLQDPERTAERKVLFDFFTFFPLLSYILALLFPSARRDMVSADYLIPFSQSRLLPKAHPARISILRTELYALLLEVHSQEMTETLFALSPASSFIDIPLQTRRKIISHSLASHNKSLTHKSEIVRLVYECAMDTTPFFSNLCDNIVVRLLDRKRGREVGKSYDDPWDRTDAENPGIVDLKALYTPQLTQMVAQELLEGSSSENVQETLKLLFPCWGLTAQNYMQVVKPFLDKCTVRLVALDRIEWLVEMVKAVMRIDVSLVLDYILKQLLPLCANKKELFFNEITKENKVSALKTLASKMIPEDNNHLLNAVISIMYTSKNLLDMVQHLVSCGASLNSVDLRATTGYHSEFLLYFLRERPTISAVALRVANHKLKTKEYIDYVDSPALTRIEKIYIAQSAFACLRIRVFEKIVQDIGPINRLMPALRVPRITPRRLVKLVERLPTRLPAIWIPLERQPGYITSLEECLQGYLSQSESQEVKTACHRLLSYNPRRHKKKR